MTTIDWNAASTSATADFDATVQKAASTLIMGIDDLMANPSAGRPAKLAVLQRLAAVLSGPEEIVAFMSGGGQAAPTTRALGGNPDDLQNELNAAETRLRQLEADRSALEEVLIVLSIPRLMPDMPYDGNNLRNTARTKLADIEHAASAAPADMVKKNNIRVKLTELKNAIDAIKTAPMSNKVDGIDAVKDKLREVVQMVS